MKMKNSAIIVIFAVSAFSLYANWPVARPIERIDMSGMMARLGEYLLLPYIKELNYNLKDAELVDLDTLQGIGDFAIISAVESSESLAASETWYRLSVCSPDLSVFLVFISKPKSLSVAKDLILERIWQRSFSNPAAISGVCTPKLEGEEYSLIIDAEPYVGKTRLSSERGLLIGVDFRETLQPPGAPDNSSQAVLAQMNAIIDAFIAFVDGDSDMTDEKKEHYLKLKAAYKTVVPDPEVQKPVGPDPFIWGNP